MRLHVVSCLLCFPVRKCLGKCDMTKSACSTRYFNTLYVCLPYLNPKNVLVEGPARNYISFVIYRYCRFKDRLYVKDKLVKANKCLFVIRNLRKDGYSQNEMDLVFKSLVLSQLTYALSIYAASPPELTVVQNFLTHCYKRNYISSHINIYSLLERSDLL